MKIKPTWIWENIPSKLWFFVRALKNSWVTSGDEKLQNAKPREPENFGRQFWLSFWLNRARGCPPVVFQFISPTIAPIYIYIVKYRYIIYVYVVPWTRVNILVFSRQSGVWRSFGLSKKKPNFTRKYGGWRCSPGDDWEIDGKNLGKS